MAAELRIDLLRHGEVAGGAKLRGAGNDEPLSDRGWRQLQAAADAHGPWDLVVSSPLARCRRFAESFAGAALVVDARLREFDFGDWDGRALDTLWAERGDVLAAFLADPERVTPPNGETAAAFRARVRSAWQDLIARESDERILVVGHGGVLRQWLADALDAPMSAHARIEWPHGALSRLRAYLEPPQPPSVSLTFHAHVAGREGEPLVETNRHE